MKLSMLLTANAIIAGAFGLAFVVAPGRLLMQYGIALPVGGLLVARLFGASLIGYCILTWMARDAADSDARRAIVTTLFVADALGAVISIGGQLRGYANALGWSTVLIYLLLTAAFGYFQFAKPAERAPTQ
jgi:hypothetical protein